MSERSSLLANCLHLVVRGVGGGVAGSTKVIEGVLS